MRGSLSYKKIISVTVVVGLSLYVSLVAQHWVNMLPLDTWVRGGIGKAAYVVITALNAFLIAPVSSVPLIPIAVSLWGSFVTAILSATGWTLGALAAFAIARKWGRMIVAQWFPDNPVDYYIRSVPGRRLFITVVFMRMIIPVDLLSYTLGATGMRFGAYALATIIGVLPFSFVLSFGATISPLLQLVGAGIIVTSIVLINYYIFSRTNL